MINHQIWWVPYFRAPASLVKYSERRGGYPPIPTTVLTHSVTQCWQCLAKENPGSSNEFLQPGLFLLDSSELSPIFGE